LLKKKKRISCQERGGVWKTWGVDFEVCMPGRGKDTGPPRLLQQSTQDAEKEGMKKGKYDPVMRTKGTAVHKNPVADQEGEQVLSERGSGDCGLRQGGQEN